MHLFDPREFQRAEERRPGGISHRREPAHNVHPLKYARDQNGNVVLRLAVAVR